MKKRIIFFLLIGLGMVNVFLLVVDTSTAHAEPFSLNSAAFKDGATMPKIFAAPNEPERACGGQNVSPPLEWSNAPKGTKSYAILMWDQEGQRGFGVSHWVAYDIPASMTSLKEGDGSEITTKFVHGAANRGTLKYRGLCPAKGELPHHYQITVMALDIAPGTLKPGLTREAFFEAAKGHSLGAVSIVGLLGY